MVDDARGSEVGGSHFTREQLEELTREIARNLVENPSTLVQQLKKNVGDPRSLESALDALRVPEDYFGLASSLVRTNALIKETKQMVHLVEFRVQSKDNSSPKERQWMESVAESCKAQGVEQDKAVAWVKYRLEPHMKVEMRNQENEGQVFDTLEKMYNEIFVKFMCPRTLDEVEMELRQVRQGPREKFNSYMAKLGEKEQELYETCGRTPMGKHRCSPEAQLMRLEGGLDVAFSKFARDQAFRDNRGWPNTVTEASCLLNYYWQACERQLPEQAALLTTEQKNNEGAKGKKRGSQAFEAGKENNARQTAVAVAVSDCCPARAW